jgi:hypothetical protein
MMSRNSFRLIQAAILALAAATWYSCSRNEVVSPVDPPGTPFSIDAVDYARNYFFVDTSYASAFNTIFNDDSAAIAAITPITDVAVWVLRAGSIRTPDEKFVMAIVDLFAYSQPYPDALRWRIPGPPETFGLFRPLYPGQFSVPLNGKAGLIALHIPISEYHCVAVSYRRGNFVCGEPDQPDTSSPMLLQLVKPQNLFSNGPLFPIPWRMVSKNVYSLGVTNIDRQNLKVTVSSGNTNTLFGLPLLHLVGLDHLDQRGNETVFGDGEFDFLPGITIDREHGDIIMPDLRPFDTGIHNALRSHGLNISGSDSRLVPAIYDTVPGALNHVRGLYTISGRAVGF